MAGTLAQRIQFDLIPGIACSRRPSHPSGHDAARIHRRVCGRLARHAALLVHRDQAAAAAGDDTAHFTGTCWRG
jgi:hypothetical protein